MNSGYRLVRLVDSHFRWDVKVRESPLRPEVLNHQLFILKIGLTEHQPDFFVYLCTVNECINKENGKKNEKSLRFRKKMMGLKCLIYRHASKMGHEYE